VTTISSELKLPISSGVLSLVRSHLRDLANQIKLPEDKCKALERSVLEACANIIKHAFEPGQANTFRLKAEVTPSAFTVSLLDFGIPFDPALAPPSPLPSAPGVPLEFRRPGPAEGMSLLEIHAHSALGAGEMVTQRIGTETAAQIRQARRDLCQIAKSEVVYLQFPLSQPGAAEFCRPAEREGFFFSALYPSSAEEGDALRLQ